MKKILAIAAAAALTAGVSAYAANPFSDVSPDDWAYQAVSDLSDQGVVEGYPDGTFKGERNMTRYELAQVIARLMAREDQLNAEQKATLDKLAGEYADELANLGVRVSNLEKKVGNISWSGDARMRYQDKSNDTDNWDGRMRIVAKAAVNDSTYAQARFVSEMNFKDSKDANTYADQLFVNHGFGDFSVRLGRQPITFGNQGGWLYGDGKGYDGAQLSYNGSKAGVTVGYGQFNTSDYGTAFTERNAFFAKGSADLKVACASYQKNCFFSIYYPAHLEEKKLRVCLAHELGHLYLIEYANHLLENAPFDEGTDTEPLSSVFGILAILDKNDFYATIQNKKLIHKSWNDLLRDFKALNNRNKKIYNQS